MVTTTSNEEKLKRELDALDISVKTRALKKFGMAALGSIPWVGGFMSAIASLYDENGEIKANDLQTQWLEEHSLRMDVLRDTLIGMAERISNLGDDVYERMESEEYLALVRKGFRQWDQAETDEKKIYIRFLLTNAVGIRLADDDLIRLFLDWINNYHEAHFAVVREIYKKPGSTRYNIWMAIHGKLVKEDSAEADLFKMLIRDLSMGGVIRQHRETNSQGQFIKAQRPQGKGNTTTTMESAFEGTKPYELTELGSKFVHYTMEDVVTRIG